MVAKLSGNEHVRSTWVERICYYGTKYKQEEHAMRIRHVYFPGGKKSALTMSYDDGQIHDRRLVEIFDRYGIRGTFHLNSGTLDRPGFIRKEEVADLYRNHEVSC